MGRSFCSLFATIGRRSSNGQVMSCLSLKTMALLAGPMPSHLGTRFMNLVSGHCKLQQHVMGHDMSRYVMVSHNVPILQESNHTKPAGIKGTRSLSHVRVVDCQEFLENFWRSIERGGLLNLKSQARTVASHPQFKLHHPNPTFAASLDATPSNLPQATGCCRSTSRTC